VCKTLGLPCQLGIDGNRQPVLHPLTFSPSVMIGKRSTRWNLHKGSNQRLRPQGQVSSN
jgi:hypothetical protein